MQVVPSLVAVVNHLFEAARRVSSVLSGQPAVLLVDELQLGQSLVDLSLESLGPHRSESVWVIREGLSGAAPDFRIVVVIKTQGVSPQDQGKGSLMTVPCL